MSFLIESIAAREDFPSNHTNITLTATELKFPPMDWQVKKMFTKKFKSSRP